MKSERKASKEFIPFELIVEIYAVAKKTSRSIAKFDLKDLETKITELMDDFEELRKMNDATFKMLEDSKPAVWTLACLTRPVLEDMSTRSTRSRWRSAGSTRTRSRQAPRSVSPTIALHGQGLRP